MIRPRLDLCSADESLASRLSPSGRSSTVSAGLIPGWCWYGPTERFRDLFDDLFEDRIID